MERNPNDAFEKEGQLCNNGSSTKDIQIFRMLKQQMQ